MKDIGGIWSICGINNDTELALGCLNGLHIASIESRSIVLTDRAYFQGKNIWNV